jgi:carbon storage regulator
MLVLSRKLNQAIMIGDDVRIVVVSVDRDQVKLGIEAPREISVHRSEVYDEIKQSAAPRKPRPASIRGSETPAAGEAVKEG